MGYNAVWRDESHPTFRRNISPPYSGSRSQLYMLPASYCYVIGLLFSRKDGGDMIFRNGRFTFTTMHGVICQKIENFVATAVSASNRTCIKFCKDNASSAVVAP
jgi:hypothetical protein